VNIAQNFNFHIMATVPGKYLTNDDGDVMNAIECHFLDMMTEDEYTKLKILGYYKLPVNWKDCLAKNVEAPKKFWIKASELAKSKDKAFEHVINDAKPRDVPKADPVPKDSGDGNPGDPSDDSGDDDDAAEKSNKDWLNDNDLNGECFVSGDAGEREESLVHRHVVFSKNLPAAKDGNAGVKVLFTLEEADRFIRLNYYYLKKVAPNLPNSDVAKIAFLRFLAARNGLVSPEFKAETYHVKYNEAIRLTTKQIRQLNMPPDGDYQTVLTDKMREKLMADFSNSVCAVAFMFRVRGHHWLPDMDDAYKNLWKKCLKDQDNPGVNWELIAHHSYHSIMPVILDNYWITCKDGGRIAGALVKRFDSAPAGVAAVRAVFAGAEDIRMCVPALVSNFKSHFDELDRVVKNLRANRWAGSINRRYYNAPALDFDEQKFGAIASVVVNALQTFAANSQLLKSKALLRVANNAPITGGIVSRSIATVATDPNLVKGMLMPSMMPVVARE